MHIRHCAIVRIIQWLIVVSICQRVDRERYQIEDDVYLNTKQQERQAKEVDKLKRRQDRTDKREQGLEAAVDDFSDSDD